MPQTVGYPVENLYKSKQNTERVTRAEELWDHGRTFRRAERESQWEQSEDQYEGEHWGGLEFDDQDERITVNMSFSTVNTIVPYVTGNDPHFLVEPYSGDADGRAARILQAWINRTWRSLEFNGNFHLETAVTDFLIYGDGYLKISFDIIDEVIGGELGDVIEMARLFVDRLDPWDVWLDPAADGIHNARWVAYRVLTPLSEVKADDKYSNTRDLTADTSHSFVAEDEKLKERIAYDTGDEADAMVEIIEFYDLIKEELVTFVPGHEMPLQVVEGIQLPIVQLGNYRIPRSPYHMGELEQLWPLQQELNKARSQMITHRRRNVQKFVAQENALAQGAMDALQSSVVNDVVFVKGQVDPSTVIVPLEVPELSATSYNVSDLVTRDIYEISGVNEYLRGATPEIRRTATEATIIEAASNVKSTHKLRLVEHAVREVGQLILDTAMDVFPLTDFEEMNLVLTGREAQAVANVEAQYGQLEDQDGNPVQDPSSIKEIETRLTSDLFSGRYEVFVESGSTELRDPQFREQRYREMFFALTDRLQALQMAGVFVNLQKILELWLEAAGVQDIDGVLTPSEQQQQMQQMQVMQQMMQGAGGGQAPTAQGLPNENAAQSPEEPIAPDNSGQLAGFPA